MIRKFVQCVLVLSALGGCADRQPIDPQTRALLFQYVMSRPAQAPVYVNYDAWGAVQPQVCLGCW